MMRELAELGRDPRLGDAVDQLLGLEPVRDELRHGDEGEAVLLGAIAWSSGRRAIEPSAIQDLADDAGRNQAGQPGEVHAGLGLPDPLQHAAGPGAKREDVARAAQVGGHGGGIDGDVDRRGAVAGRDAGGHAEAALRVDADREGGGQLLGVPLGHLRAGRAGRSARR